MAVILRCRWLIIAVLGLHLGEGRSHAAPVVGPPPTTPQGALQELRDGNARFVAHIPDQVHLKLEFEIEDDGSELEIELTW